MKRKKVGLVLSGGGARGFAHIGVIKTLEKNNIPIDIVSGTSIGAVVGALYCAGYSGVQLEQIAKETNWKNLIDLAIPKKGILKGDKIEAYLRDLIDDKKFSELKKPLFIPAVDLNKQQEIIFYKGDVVKAIRASISLPGIFLPVETGERVLVDGGVLDNLPIEVLRENDAEIIIAVNLNQREIKEKVYEKISKEQKKEPVKNFHIASLISESYNMLEIEKTRLFLEDFPVEVLITPELKDTRIHQFQKIDSIIKRGTNACEKEMNKIKLLTKEKKSFGKGAINFFKKAKDIIKKD